MGEDKVQGCVQAAKGPIAAKPKSTNQETTEEMKGPDMTVTVGKAAPEFEASAYHEGGFKNVSLSSFKGKWVFLCFYPGDFTFV